MKDKQIISVDVWGSCISRDSLKIGGDDKGIKVSNFFQGDRFDIQFCEHNHVDRDLNEYLSLNEHVAPCKWIVADWNKHIPAVLDKSDSEWLILDAKSYSYCAIKTLFEDTEEYYTKTVWEMYHKKLIPDYKEIRIDDETLSSQLDSFIMWVKKRYGNNIILVEAYDEPKCLDKCGNIVVKSVNINAIKQQLFFNNYFHQKTNCWVVEYPYTLTDSLHKWGENNVHYITEYYRYVYTSIMTIIRNESDINSKLLNLKLNCSLITGKIICKDYLSENNTIQRIISAFKDGQLEISKELVKSIQHGSHSQYNILSKILTTTFDREYLKEILILDKELIILNLECDYELFFEELSKFNKDTLFDDLDDLSGFFIDCGKYDSVSRIAYLYFKGNGVNVDYEKARYLYNVSLKNGQSNDSVNYLNLLWTIGTVDSIEELSINKSYYNPYGKVYSKYLIGKAYKQGRGCSKNLDKAIEFLRGSVQDGIEWARIELFDTIWEKGDEALYNEMISVIKEMVQDNNPHAIGRYARAYRDGKGVSKDLMKAKSLMRRAADDGVGWATIEYKLMKFVE